MTSHRSGRPRLPDVKQEPFERIVERHGATVLRVCRAVVGPVAADDAWSETFLAAMRAYPALRADSNVEAWLVTIAHRKAIDQVRVRARDPIPTSSPPDRPAADPQVHPEEAAIGWAQSELWAAVGSLPLKQRQAIAYHYLGGLPYTEVAELIGGTPAASRRAAADGIAALRRSYPALSAGELS